MRTCSPYVQSSGLIVCVGCIVSPLSYFPFALAIPTWSVAKPPLWEDSGVPRYVFAFDEPCDGGRELLGGKGIGLAEMTQLGVPVPAGFTITTEACRAYMESKELPDGLEQEVDGQVRRLEEQAGKRFGDPADPLLVSVRSGAAVSMPGMMDTILNVGLNDIATTGLAATTGNARFANDSYRRLIQMYGETVDNVDPHRFEQELQSLKAARGAVRTSSSRPTTSPVSSRPSRRSTSRTPAGRSRRTRTSS